MTIPDGLLETNPDDEAVLINAGSCMAFVGPYEDALPVLNRSAEKFPGAANAYLNRSYVFIKQISCMQESADLETYECMKPDQAHGYDHRTSGCYVLQAGDAGTALIHLQTARNPDPEVPDLEVLIREAESATGAFERMNG